MPFDGLRVLSLESRRSREMSVLIEKQRGDGFTAPSMREVPLEENAAAFAWGVRLLNGEFDGVILLTGVGTRILWQTLTAKYSENALKEAFSKLTKIVRGPKPAAALRELGLQSDVQVPEPNTWRELLEVMRDRPESNLALQEYGKSNQDLIAGLQALGKQVTTVHIYKWDLPADTEPLRQAVGKLIAGQVDVALFTTSVQIVHLMRIAAEEGVEQQVVEALQSACVASIGPTTTEALGEYGIRADFEPSHPKMGLLVNELAGKTSSILAGKR